MVLVFPFDEFEVPKDLLQLTLDKTEDFEIYDCSKGTEMYALFKSLGGKLRMRFGNESQLKGVQLYGFVFATVKKEYISPWLLRNITLYFFDYYDSWKDKNKHLF